MPLHQIGGLAADSSGNIYFTSSNCVFKLDQNGLLARIAGNARAGYAGDGGAATSAQLSSPTGVALDASGNIFVADSGNYRIRRVSATGIITTIAGTGQFGLPVNGAAAVNTPLGSPSSLAVDTSGRLLITDTSNNLLLRVSPSGIGAIVAGTGVSGYTGDGGPAVRARLAGPHGLAVDTAGNIFISDTGNSSVRRLAADGTITTFAGTGFVGFSGDGGPAVLAQFIDPEGLAFDRSGNLLIVDAGNNRVRKISSDGVVTTLAGNGNTVLAGDGGPATTAGLAGVGNIVVDSLGNIVIDASTRTFAGAGFSAVLIARDPGTGNFLSSLYVRSSSGSGVAVLRKISTAGTITTVAGNNSTGLYGAGGLAANAQFGSVEGVAVDGFGNLFIADPVDDEVLKVSSTGIMTVVAGDGVSGFSGDGGLATSAELNNPVSVAIDGSGKFIHRGSI